MSTFWALCNLFLTFIIENYDINRLENFKKIFCFFVLTKDVIIVIISLARLDQ